MESFLEYIKVAHPVLRQADLLPQNAEAEKKIARGAYDPVIDIHYNRKSLWNYKENWNPTIYYESNQYFFKVPAYIGNLKFGFERYTGINVNPENFTPPQGLAYMDIEIPLARGLFWDERRNMLRQAELFLSQNLAERQKIINKLLFSACKKYWEWFEAEQKLEIQTMNLLLAEERLTAIKERVLLGDLPAIDSLEAKLETEKRKLLFQEAEMNKTKAKLEIATYLWGPDLTPLELSDSVTSVATYTDSKTGNISVSPTPLTNLQYEELILNALNSHPEAIKLQAKIKGLEIEQKFRRQELLPVIDLNYKPFLLPTTSDKKIAVNPDYLSYNYLTQNFKFGINIYMPIFLRKERGKLEKTKLKTLETKYELSQTQRIILNELQSCIQAFKTYTEMLKTQSNNMKYAETLRDAEVIKFQNGESSLFLINSRERSALSEQEKRIEIQIKLWKSFADMYYKAGYTVDSILKMK